LPEDDFYTPTDIDALRMENELLAFEVRFLKAQLAELGGPADPRAEEDLVLLLRRLSNSPLGPFLRLRHSYRTLEQRYLDTDD